MMRIDVVDITQFYQYLPSVIIFIWTHKKKIISKFLNYSKTKIGFIVFSPITLPIAIYFLYKLVSSDELDLSKYTSQKKITDFQ